MYKKEIQTKNVQRGFTLIEVLLVIAILAILAAITTVAINPARQLANARDAERMTDVYAIMNAVHQYSTDNDGAFPEELTTEELEICQTEGVTCANMHNLSVLTDDERYLVTMPIDPSCEQEGCPTEEGTGYFIAKTENGRVTVSAPAVELRDSISVTR